MKKSKLIITAITAVLVIAGAGYWFVAKDSDDQIVNNETTSQQEHTQEVKKPEITISEDKKSVSYEGISGKTALEILKDGTDVETETSSYGEFVTSIGGVKADANSEYWSFYVNGSYASEGAGTYKTTDGEKIEWKLESL